MYLIQRLYPTLLLYLSLLPLTALAAESVPVPGPVMTEVRKYMGTVVGPKNVAVLFCSKTLNKPFYGNISIRPIEYSATAHRDLEDLGSLFGSDLEDYFSGLAQGSLVLLPGGGFSIYGIQQALLGHHVVAISSAQFYHQFLALLGQPGTVQKLLTQTLTGSNRTIDNDFLPIHALNRLARVLSLKLPRGIKTQGPLHHFPFNGEETWTLDPSVTLETYALEIAQLISQIMFQLKRLEPPVLNRRGSLQLIPPIPAQDFFASGSQYAGIVSGVADLILDVADAMLYSTDRVNLLGQYHYALEPGRRAYILSTIIFDFVRITRPESLVMFEDVIKRTGENIVPLDEYLARMFPAHFRNYVNSAPSQGDFSKKEVKPGETVQNRVLVIEKPERGDLRTTLNGLLKTRHVWFFGPDQDPRRAFPLVEYMEQAAGAN